MNKQENDILSQMLGDKLEPTQENNIIETPEVQESLVETPEPEINLTETQIQELEAQLEPVIEQPAKEKEIDFNQLLKERTGGKYSSLEELQSKAEEQRLSFASDRIKKLNDLEAAGKDIKEILKWESLGLEGLDTENEQHALSVLKFNMKNKNPKLNDKDIDVILKRKYNTDPESGLSDEDIEINSIQRKIDAEEARLALLDIKKTFELPSAPDNSHIAEERNALKNEWMQSVNQSLSNYTEEKFKLGESNEFTYVVKNETKDKLKSLMASPETFFDRYVDKSGSMNMEKFRSDMLLLEDFESMKNAMLAQHESIVKRNFINSIKNPAQKGGTYSSKEQIADPRDQLAEKLFNI